MGVLYAVLAAVCNSCIGIFINKLYDLNMNSVEMAFFRCLFALMIVSLFMINKRFRKSIFKTTKKEVLRYAFVSFWGIFIMYSFEILSLQFIAVSLESFLLYSSGIFTIILSAVFLKEGLGLKKICSIVLVFLGIFVMFLTNCSVEGNLIGLIMALIAGGGYSLFLFFMKKFDVESSLKTLFFLFLFGTMYLAIPALYYNNFTISAEGVPYLLCLAIIPTMGGFYCTSKALSLIEAGKVQLFEMTEPFFSTILAYIVLGQVVTRYDLTAGVLIMIGLLILESDSIKAMFKRKELNVKTE